MASDGKHWGGKRIGAGRPPSSTVTAKIKLPREVWALIEAQAAHGNRTPEEEAAHVLIEHATASPSGTMKSPNPRD